MSSYLKIRPVDVLHLRGNHLFGGSGDHGEALMPPWPSVFAGALRTRMLIDAGVDLQRFARSADQAVSTNAEIAKVLGTPRRPGTFRITSIALCRDRGDGAGDELLVPLPADCVVEPADSSSDVKVRRLVPMPLGELGPGISAEAELPWVPVLPSPKPVKPRHGYWLTADGLGRYLDGGTPEPGHVVHEAQLWASDPRLGIALDGGSRTAARGMIYTAETVALRPEVSFVVGVDGVPEPLLPRDGLVRLGGDGRGARLEPCTIAAPWSARPAQRYFTITLATLGLFPRGWLLPGVHRAGECLELRIEGLRASLLAAVVPRFEVVSGWDLALHRPKPAQRASPRGSTYFFEVGHGDPGCLEQLVSEGLWPLLGSEMEGDDGAGSAWLQRKAEGFNNVWVGSWCPARPAA